MKELLTTYSISDILVFIVLIALAIRGVVTFYDWGKSRLKAIFDQDHIMESKQKEIDEKINKYDVLLTMIQENQDHLNGRLDMLDERINLLVESDKDSIKSYLVDKHKEVTRQGYIDSYDYDVFLKRYSHYKDEGGNSYIGDLVDEVKKIAVK